MMNKFGNLAALILLLTGCKISMDNYGEQEQHQKGGGLPTTTSVDSVKINIPTKVCVNTNIQLTADVFPYTSDQVGTWYGGNGNASITSSGMLSSTKVGTVPVTFRQTKTGQTASATLTIVDCSTGGGSTVTGVVITPVGAQTIVQGQSETYFIHVEPMSADQRFTLSLSGSCISTQILGPAAGTGYTQVKITGIAVGSCTLTAKSVVDTSKVSNAIVFTVISNTGTVGNAYITIDPTSWTTATGGTKQFTATCHNFPTGTECKPYFYSVGTGCVAVNGVARTFTNDPVFGTGTYPAGYAKARGSNCTTQVYVQASLTNNQIYNYSTVTVSP
jgi:hypothetical protein